MTYDPIGSASITVGSGETRDVYSGSVASSWAGTIFRALLRLGTTRFAPAWALDIMEDWFGCLGVCLISPIHLM